MLRFMSVKVKVFLDPIRYSRQMSVKAQRLKYEEHGEPIRVLKLAEEVVPNPRDGEVLLKVLVAPTNPVDSLTIQGVYPVRPTLPAVAGGEFVGEVIGVGKNVKNFKTGDWVIPTKSTVGAWTSHGVYLAKDLLKVSKKIGAVAAATLTVNPCTAYRMLKDFGDLKKGDTVIQNGANSALGQIVHQLCKSWGINSVGVVRDRPEISKLKAYLKSLGATEVLTEKEIEKTDIFEKIKKPKLALDCIGGKSSSAIAAHLDYKGVHVTYGSMTWEPVVVDGAAFIFKNVNYAGFWLTSWFAENASNDEPAKMYAELTKLLEEGILKLPAYELISLDKYKQALQPKEFTQKKILFNFQ